MGSPPAQPGETNQDHGNGIAVTGLDRDVVITGRFVATIDIDGTELYCADDNMDAACGFVARFDSDGTLDFARSFHHGVCNIPDPMTNGVCVNYGQRLSARPDGGYVVLGAFNDVITFGDALALGAGGPYTFAPYVVSLDESNGIDWRFALEGEAGDWGQDVVVDAAGNVLVVGGFFSASFDLGGSSLVNAGGMDSFAASYDAQGQLQWSHHLGTADSERAFAADFDDSGSAFISLQALGDVDVGAGGVLPALGGADPVLVRLAADGTPLEARRYGGANDDEVYTIAVHGDEVVLGGAAGDGVDFGGGPIAGQGGLDACVARVRFADMGD